MSSLTRVAIISVLPEKNVTNAELKAELEERLRSKSFSVERIAILDEQDDLPLLTPPTSRK